MVRLQFALGTYARCLIRAQRAALSPRDLIDCSFYLTPFFRINKGAFYQELFRKIRRWSFNPYHSRLDEIHTKKKVYNKVLINEIFFIFPPPEHLEK